MVNNARESYNSSKENFTIKALRSHNHMVPASVACSLLLRLLVTLSTGLISLSRVQVGQGTVPRWLLDSFRADRDRLYGINMSPRTTLEGITSFNASYPKGTDENFAFSRFNVPDLAPLSKPPSMSSQQT